MSEFISDGDKSIWTEIRKHLSWTKNCCFDFWSRLRDSNSNEICADSPAKFKEKWRELQQSSENVCFDFNERLRETDWLKSCVKRPAGFKKFQKNWQRFWQIFWFRRGRVWFRSSVWKVVPEKSGPIAPARGPAAPSAPPATAGPRQIPEIAERSGENDRFLTKRSWMRRPLRFSSKRADLGVLTVWWCTIGGDIDGLGLWKFSKVEKIGRKAACCLSKIKSGNGCKSKQLHKGSALTERAQPNGRAPSFLLSERHVSSPQRSAEDSILDF